MDTIGIIVSDKALIIQYMEISGTSIQNRDKVQNCKCRNYQGLRPISPPSPAIFKPRPALFLEILIVKGIQGILQSVILFPLIID